MTVDPIVREKFMSFSVPKEGRMDCMYLDVKGYVTCGVGNLLENTSEDRPVPVVFTLPWKRRLDNQPATRAEIEAEWYRVNVRTDLADASSARRRAITTLYLTDAAIDALVFAKLEANDATLKRQFPGMAAWPWQAQLALHSMSWARGENGYEREYPKLTSALRRRAFATAAAECRIAGEATNKGLIPRNEANKQLFLDAAASPVARAGADPRAATPVSAPGSRGSGSWFDALIRWLTGARA